MNEQITKLIHEIEDNYECATFSVIDSYINIKIIETILKSNLNVYQKEVVIQSYALCKITAIEALEDCYTLK